MDRESDWDFLDFVRIGSVLDGEYHSSSFKRKSLNLTSSFFSPSANCSAGDSELNELRFRRPCRAVVNPSHLLPRGRKER